jgi:hypothetical protein
MEESMFVEISTKVQVGGRHPVGKAYRKDPQDQPSQQGTDDEQHHQVQRCLRSRTSQPQHWGEDPLKIPGTSGRSVPRNWDNARQGKANLVAGFHKTLNEFISYHFSNTDLINQKNMMAKAKKPFKYMVEVLCSRLRHLNKLMSKLPGANNMLP